MFNRIFSTERITTDFFRNISDFATQKKQLDVYVVVGRDLVKIQMMASVNNLCARASMVCKVLEVNGEGISKEEQDLNICRAEFNDSCPTTEEQLKVVREALAKFNIHGKILSVSKEYAEGQLRMIRIRERMRGKEGRRDNVHI